MVWCFDGMDPKECLKRTKRELDELMKESQKENKISSTAYKQFIDESKHKMMSNYFRLDEQLDQTKKNINKILQNSESHEARSLSNGHSVNVATIQSYSCESIPTIFFEHLKYDYGKYFTIEKSNRQESCFIYFALKNSAKA